MRWKDLRPFVFIPFFLNLLLWFIKPELVMWAIPYALIIGVFDIVEDRRR